MVHSLFNKAGVNSVLGEELETIEHVSKFTPEIRYVAIYMQNIVDITKNIPLFQQILDGEAHADALLAVYRNQQNDQTLTENDLLLALEGSNGENPFEYWKIITGQPTATIEDYNAAFTGPQGDSAYTVWKDAQPEGTSTTLYDYFQDIKGDPAENNTPDNILWDVGVPLRDIINRKADKIMQWIGLRSWSRFDIVEYQEQLYYAKNDIPAGSWNPTLWQEIGSVTDLSDYVTRTALDNDLAGKVTKDTYDEQRALLETKTVVAGVKTTADTALANSSANADAIMELGEHPLTADQVRINAEARETNRQATIQNATDIGTLRTDVPDIVDNRITTSIASGAIKTRLDELTVDSGLQLPDFQAGRLEQLCTVSGEDTSVGYIDTAPLNLVCSSKTPPSGIAELRGTIRFTVNSSWTGAVRLTDGLKQTLTTATQISGGDTGEQEWEIEGVEWDLSDRSPKRLELESHDFTPSIVEGALAYTFSGELIGQSSDGEAVEPIHILIDDRVTPSLLQTHSATIAQQHPGTSFTVNTGNNPLSTDVFTVPTKDSTNADLTAITDGELVKFEVPFFFDTQSHEGFQPECGLVIKADGIVVKTYSFENNNLLDPTQLNLLTFYAGKGETLTFEPTVATSRYGDGSIAITVYPYFNLIRVLQLGVLYNAGKELAESVVAVQTAKQRLIDNAQDAQIGVLGEGVQALRDEYETSVARLEALETRLANPGYAVLDRARVSEPTSTTTLSTTRSSLGDQWGAKLETGASPYVAPILFDLTTGGVSPSSSATLDFLYVRDSVVYANVLTPFQASIPAHDLPGTVTRSGTLVSADSPIQISLGQDGHHRQTSLTLTPDPNNLPADGAEFHVDFHAVVGGNNRALYESNIVWGNGVPVQKEATNENGESVIVNSFQQGNQVIVQINETGAESLPIAGGYLSLYAHYDYTVPEVPAVNASSAEVKVGDQVNGHFVVLLETGAGAVSQSRPLVIHYGNGQSINTNRGAAYINFYTNNDDNVGNIYSTPYREDRTWDLTQLQANAEAGQTDLGFFRETVTNHSTSKLTLDTGLEIINKDEEVIDVAEEITELKKNSGGGGDAPNGVQYARKILTGAEIKNGTVVFDDPKVLTEVIVGVGVKVITPCDTTDSINFTVANPLAGGASVQLDISLQTEGESTASIVGYASESGAILSNVGNAVSTTCQIELVIGYIDFNPFNI